VATAWRQAYAPGRVQTNNNGEPPMPALLFILGLLLWLVAFVTMTHAPSISQEIAGFLILIAGCVMFTGGAIVYAIDQVRAAVEGKRKPEKPPEHVDPPLI